MMALWRNKGDEIEIQTYEDMVRERENEKETGGIPQGTENAEGCLFCLQLS